MKQSRKNDKRYSAWLGSGVFKRHKPRMSSEYYRKHNRQYNASMWHKNRIRIIGLLGGKCVACNETSNICIYRTQKTTWGTRALGFMREEKLQEALKVCELRCSKHKPLHAEGTVTHGTWFAAYKVKCPCDKCDEFKLNSRLMRREKRREAKCTTMTNQMMMVESSINH